MRSTFMGFETATRGLMSSQKALDIVGNNVANVGVTGYTRQRVDLVSLSVNTRYSRYSSFGISSLMGQGSTVNGIGQIRDSYLDKRFRDEYADVGYYDTVSAILSDVENSLSEIEPTTITSALAKLENALSELQGESTEVNASSVMTAARTLTQVFSQISTKLNNQWAQEQEQLGDSIGQVNSLLEQIAQLNGTIRDEITISYGGSYSTYGPNELFDQRNVLIDELSKYADISVKSNSDGTVTITMGDDNHVAVDGTEHDRLVMGSGKAEKSVTMSWKTSGEPTRFTTGALQAAYNMLNGRGIGASPSKGESLDNGILYYMDKVDTFAKTLANAFNHVVPIVNSGVATGEYKQLFSFGGDGEETAANITVNSQWLNDASYLITDIHASGEGSTDTTFAANLISLFSSKHNFGEFTGTFTEYISFYTNSQLATDISYYNTCLETGEEVTESILNDISEVSGVSLDEEGIDMSQWTKAYNAMSRVMTAMDECLDKLINETGLVGR